MHNTFLIKLWTQQILLLAEDQLNIIHLQVSQPYSSFFSDESLTSLQTKVAEPSQVTGPVDTLDNDVQSDNAAAFDVQAQAEDNDDGEGDVGMNDACFDDD